MCLVRITVNILAFQLAWWACVLSVRADAAWIGMGAAVGVFALHLAISPARASEARFIPLAAALGYVVDTVATRLGALQFESPPTSMLPTPFWISALWLAFATTLNTTFAWLRKNLILAAILGAASGPLSYAAGAALGIVTMPQPLRSTLVLGAIWGATLPLLVILARTTVGQRGPYPVRLSGSRRAT